MLHATAFKPVAFRCAAVDSVSGVGNSTITRFVEFSGSEGEGLRVLTKKLCDETVTIPMAEAIDSLNVSVATGVLLFEVVRQRASSNGG